MDVDSNLPHVQLHTCPDTSACGSAISLIFRQIVSLCSGSFLRFFLACSVRSSLTDGLTVSRSRVIYPFSQCLVQQCC